MSVSCLTKMVLLYSLTMIYVTLKEAQKSIARKVVFLHIRGLKTFIR